VWGRDPVKRTIKVSSALNDREPSPWVLLEDKAHIFEVSEAKGELPITLNEVSGCFIRSASER
jgi:hypothetical protein